MWLSSLGLLFALLISSCYAISKIFAISNLEHVFVSEMSSFSDHVAEISEHKQLFYVNAFTIIFSLPSQCVTVIDYSIPVHVC